MATSLGYDIRDKSPVYQPTTLCSKSVGGDDGTEWNLRGYLFEDCIVCKE